MNIPQDLKAAFGRIAKEYGDEALLDGCAFVMMSFARLGAREANTKRRGDPNIECAECRARAAAQRQFEETMQRLQTRRPLGGASPSEEGQDP